MNDLLTHVSIPQYPEDKQNEKFTHLDAVFYLKSVLISGCQDMDMKNLHTKLYHRAMGRKPTLQGTFNISQFLWPDGGGFI